MYIACLFFFFLQFEVCQGVNKSSRMCHGMLSKVQISSCDEDNVNPSPKIKATSFIIKFIKSNKKQEHADTYLLQSHSTCFWCPSHPKSGIHKTVIAASSTGLVSG
jgi:hypothetical protein